MTSSALSVSFIPTSEIFCLPPAQERADLTTRR